jgi:protein-tyrosine phosphatase
MADAATQSRVHTSQSHPIEVFWVADEAHGQPGRLGLTFAPGKCAYSTLSAAMQQRDLHADLDRLRDHHRVDVLVSLMEEHEYALLGVPTLLAEAAARGIVVEQFTIRDVSVPRADQAEAVTALVGSIRAGLCSGRRVVVHCRGGIGRSGLIASIVVGSYGHEAAEAMAIVRTVQPKAVETRGQERYVAEALARWGAAA